MNGPAPREWWVEKVRLTTVASANVLSVHWRGRCDLREPAAVFRPFFDPLIAEAAVTQRQIQLRFERLDFLNSSTLAYLIQLVNAARALDVPIELVYAENLRWQSVSFEALRHALQIFEHGGGPSISVTAAAV